MQEPRIEFPCDYPIKIIGDASPDFMTEVVAIVTKYDPSMAMDKVKEKSSRGGRYTSVTVLFWATGEKQLKSLFAELSQRRDVRFVL